MALLFLTWGRPRCRPVLVLWLSPMPARWALLAGSFLTWCEAPGADQVLALVVLSDR